MKQFLSSSRRTLPSAGMPLRIGWFLIIFIFYYLIQVPLRELAMFYSFAEFYERYADYRMLMIMTNGFIVFLGQALGIYLVCFFTYKRYPLSVTITSGLIIWLSLTILRFLVEQVLFDRWLGFQNYGNDPTFGYYLADNIYWGAHYGIVGIVLYFVRFSLYSERRRSELAIEKRTTELALLRSQVNPHFLFNTLNNLYSLIYTKSDNALKVVEKISGLLRYSLYEVETTVALQQEIKYLRDFIELERLRYDFPLALELNIPKDLQDVRVPPFLFIPFVENAFKHGDLRNFAQPVEIVLQQTANQLIFKCVNQIKAQEKDRVGGIGLENVRRRLKLLYGKKHTLDVANDADVFAVELRIPTR